MEKHGLCQSEVPYIARKKRKTTIYRCHLKRYAQKKKVCKSVGTVVGLWRIFDDVSKKRFAISAQNTNSTWCYVHIFPCAWGKVGEEWDNFPSKTLQPSIVRRRDQRPNGRSQPFSIYSTGMKREHGMHAPTSRTGQKNASDRREMSGHRPGRLTVHLP